MKINQKRFMTFSFFNLQLFHFSQLHIQVAFLVTEEETIWVLPYSQEQEYSVDDSMETHFTAASQFLKIQSPRLLKHHTEPARI